jgi:ATP-dependent DNA helicase RecG
MIEQIKIDDSEAKRILDLEESHYLDLKSVDITPAKLTQAVSAFANTAGGELFIGIEESGRNGKKTRSWRGFADIEKANDHIHVVEAMSPLGTHYRASFLRTDSRPGHVLQLIIFKTKDILYASDGIAYVRRGAQKQAVKSEEALHRLRLDKGIISFEDETLNLDPKLITNSVTIIKFMLNVVPTGEPDVWVAKQNLIAEGKPTVAGLMLFADEPQAALPKRSAIKLFRYMTKESEGNRESLAFDP